jgi:hypothetical protein
MAINEILDRVNTQGALNRLRDNVQAIGNKAAGGVTGEIEALLGTGLTQNVSDQVFTEKEQLRFPLDNADEYRAFVRFQIRGHAPEPPIEAQKEFDAKRAAALEAQSKKGLDDTISEAFTSITDGFEDLTNKAKEVMDKISSFGEEDAAEVAAAENMQQKSHVLERQEFQKKQFQLGTYVDLYLPAGISIADGVNIENVDLGRMGEAARQSAAARGSVMGATAEGLEQLGKSFGEALSGAANPTVGKLAAVQLLGALPGADAMTGGVKSALGVTTNPNTRALFKSVNMRTFNFAFKLIPTSEAETLEIHKIIKFFREQLYPETITFGHDDYGQLPIGYRFPNTFQASIRYRQKKSDQPMGRFGNDMFGITKYLPAYLTNFTATYNPSSMGYIKGGRFQEIDISLSFAEQETLDKRKVAEEGY